MSIKTERINDMLVSEISYIIRTEVKNKNIEFVTITDAKVTSDLGYAKIYFTTLNDNKRDEITKALRTAKGFIRSKLYDRMDIRHIPELEFVYDESIEYGKKIENIIEELHEEGK